MIAGVAAALVAGVGFGFWARPQLTPLPGAAASRAPASPSADGAQVPIAVNPPPKPAEPAPGRLPTLPPEMTAASQQAARPWTETEPSANAQTSSNAPSSLPAQASPAESAAAPRPAPQLQASFDCATARPGAEQAVCADPELAADDRRLAHAYRRALRSGADPDDLRQEQRDWIAIREDAAQRSPQALAQVYGQRIQDLNRIADDASDAPPDDGE